MIISKQRKKSPTWHSMRIRISEQWQMYRNNPFSETNRPTSGSYYGNQKWKSTVKETCVLRSHRSHREFTFWITTKFPHQQLRHHHPNTLVIWKKQHLIIHTLQSTPRLKLAMSSKLGKVSFTQSHTSVKSVSRVWNTEDHNQVFTWTCPKQHSYTKNEKVFQLENNRKDKKTNKNDRVYSLEENKQETYLQFYNINQPFPILNISQICKFKYVNPTYTNFRNCWSNNSIDFSVCSKHNCGIKTVVFAWV